MDAWILTESMNVLVLAVEVLHEEAKPPGLKVSWVKTKIQSFRGSLNDSIQSVHAFVEDIKVTKSFTYLVSVQHYTVRCHGKKNSQISSKLEFGFIRSSLRQEDATLPMR